MIMKHVIVLGLQAVPYAGPVPTLRDGFLVITQGYVKLDAERYYTALCYLLCISYKSSTECIIGSICILIHSC